MERQSSIMLVGHMQYNAAAQPTPKAVGWIGLLAIAPAFAPATWPTLEVGNGKYHNFCSMNGINDSVGKTLREYTARSISVR